MFNSLILKHLWKDKNKTKEGTILLKEIALEFLPFIGLTLDSGNIYANIGKIQTVTYALAENIFSRSPGFRCEVSDVVPYWSELYGRVLEHDELVRIYKDDGWKEYMDMGSKEKITYPIS